MYSSDLATDSGPLQQYLEPLLHRFNVDLAGLFSSFISSFLISPVDRND